MLNLEATAIYRHSIIASSSTASSLSHKQFSIVSSFLVQRTLIHKHTYINKTPLPSFITFFATIARPLPVAIDFITNNTLHRERERERERERYTDTHTHTYIYIYNRIHIHHYTVVVRGDCGGWLVIIGNLCQDCMWPVAEYTTWSAPDSFIHSYYKLNNTDNSHYKKKCHCHCQCFTKSVTSVSLILFSVIVSPFIQFNMCNVMFHPVLSS